MNAAVGPLWVDFHCHLDLYPDHREIINECDLHRVATLTVTTTPKAWSRNRELAANSKLVRVALGLHPQLVSDRAHEYPLFEKYLSEARYVGEIGLDAGPRFYQSMPLQEKILASILRACVEQGGKILSIHSVRAVAKVLAALEDSKFPDCGKAVLHWFTGSMSEMNRAVELGCYFSVNREMLRSDRHRQLVASMPPDRILTETDGPFVEHGGRPIRPSDVDGTVKQLSEATKTDFELVKKSVVNNLRVLLS